MLTLEQYYDVFDTKKSSIKTQFNAIKRLKKFMGIRNNNLNFLEDYSGIKNALRENDQNRNQRKNIYSAVKKFTKYHKLPMGWITKKFDIVAKKVNQKLEEQRKTPRQIDNWISKKELKKQIIDVLEKEVYTLLNKDELSLKERKIFQNYLLFLFAYTYKRRVMDYSEMKIIDSYDFRFLNCKQRQQYNWCISNGNKIKFYFYVFKNSDSYIDDLPEKIKPNPKITKLIKKWLMYNRHDYFFINEKNEKFSPQMLSKTIRRVGERLTGKKIGVGMIRTIIATDEAKNELSIKQKRDRARKYCHNSRTHEEHYIKKY